MEIVTSENSNCQVKLKKSQLRLVENVKLNVTHDYDSSNRKTEDQARRKAMHELINRMDTGSKATAKSIISTSFQGENQWYSQGPLSLLTRSINKTIRVALKVGRSKVSQINGTLLLFDRHFNLLLKDATVNNQYHQSIFIRGSLVVFIS